MPRPKKKPTKPKKPNQESELQKLERELKETRETARRFLEMRHSGTAREFFARARVLEGKIKALKGEEKGGN